MRWIYTLLLSESKYYVGYTENLERRMTEHFTGEGSKWTQLYKPIKIIEIVPETNDWQEDFTTLVMMRKYGINNVRGGCWCVSGPIYNIPENYDKIDPFKSLEENLVLVSKNTTKRNEIPKESDTLDLFKEGKSEFQIGQLTGMTVIEVENHIINMIKKGEMSFSDIGLTPFKTMQIETVINKLNADNRSFLSIKSLCDKNISVADIRYYMALR